MIEHPNVIPIAVVTAVGVFIARELLEAFRRFKTNSRKLDAIRRLVAAECERNYFAINRMIEQVNSIADALKKDFQILIEETTRGVPRLAFLEDGEELTSSSPISLVQTGVVEKYLFEAAALNKPLFELMEKVLDNLADAKHVRDGIIEYVSNDTIHLEAFAEHYAPGELSEALESVQALYFNCTLEPLVQGRVR